MILPIYALGQPILKKKAQAITPDYPGLETLIENMWETMYAANGMGLAAPQVGHSIRLFIVDTKQIMEEGREEEGTYEVFINPQRIDEFGDLWTHEEGCLSIPHIRANVERYSQARFAYLNAQFEEREIELKDMHARVALHEYDHLEGILFTEKLKPFKRRLLKRKLESIRKGKVKADYTLKYYS